MTNRTASCLFQIRLGVCYSHNGDRNLLKEQPKLTSEDVSSGDLKDEHGTHNISLHQACEDGNLDVVKYLITQNLEEINCRDKKGRTPVLVAAMNGHLPVFKYLVNESCDLSVLDYHNNSVLHFACCGGNGHIIKHLIFNEKCDIERRGRYSRSSIMLAAICGKTEAFDLLVTKGSNVTAVDKKNNNILHLACIGGHVDMVRHIVSQNMVSIESRGQEARTPLLIAAWIGSKDVFDLLMERGCDVTKVDAQRENVLHLACSGRQLDMVQYIVSKNLVIEERRNQEGRTPVLIAAWVGSKDVFDFLLKRGCDVTAVDYQNENILHLACSGGHLDMVQYIVSRNIVDKESRGFASRTPLLIAAAEGHKQLFDFLVGAGCDVKVMDDEYNNVLHVACIGGNVDMVKWIISNDIVDIESNGFLKRTPLSTSVEFGHRELVDIFLRQGSKLTVVDNDQNNILHLACKNGHVSMVEYLMTLGVVEWMGKMKNKYGLTPLQVAWKKGHVAVVSLLKGRN